MSKKPKKECLQIIWDKVIKPDGCICEDSYGQCSVCHGIDKDANLQDVLITLDKDRNKVSWFGITSQGAIKHYLADGSSAFITWYYLTKNAEGQAPEFYQSLLPLIR